MNRSLLRADDVGAGVVRRAVPPQVPGHGRLTPLGPVQGRGQGQVLPLEPDVVHAALREVRVDLERPHAGVLGLAAGVDALLLVDGHHLVAGEDERVVVAPALAAVEGEDGDGAVPLHLDGVPLAVVDEDGRQPYLFLLRPQRVQVVPEAELAVLDLEWTNARFKKDLLNTTK